MNLTQPNEPSALTQRPAPRVDIIVPAYNAARYLEPALQSVIAQDFADWRILLVNDGSTDATPEIASRYQRELGDRMLVINQPNAGLPAARNAAIRASSAEILALLDADDLWLPSRLSETVRVFDAQPAVGLTYGLIDRIDSDGRIFATFSGNPRHAEGWIASAIYMRLVELPCPTVSFRRRCMDKVGLFDETMRATEDRDLWLRIAQRFPVACIPRVIAHYRTSPSSMSTDPDRMLRSQLQFIAKHSGSPGCGWTARRRATARVYKQQAEVYADRGTRGLALRNALRASLIWPFSLANLRTAGSLFLRSVRRPKTPRT